MADRRGGNTPEDLDQQDEGFVFVFDRRHKNGGCAKISLGGLFDYQMFRLKVKEAMSIQESDDEFYIVTTNRLKITNSNSYEELVESGDTLYILNDALQDLVEPVKELIEYLPHYDTLVKSGMYEYYESAGQNPLCFAFAELIDNALAATASNEGPRKIKLTIYFDTNPGANAVCVSDNGSGMTSKDLNNWAVYRLSKFNRNFRAGKNSQPWSSVRDLPRSLNSDISYFGVGGKQAIFFIGNSTTVITKTKYSNDVHELTLSKQDFEMKEKHKEPIYSGYINNRRIGDSSHIPSSNKILKELIEEETNDGSFTNVLITGIDQKQVTFLKQNFNYLCRQFAHIYHYYLHGPMGNIKDKVPGMRLESPFRNMEIEVDIKDKGTVTHHVSLTDIEDDLESLFLKSTSSLFEFNAHVEGVRKVEGVLRYHPFLYDKETFPDLQNIDPTASNDPSSAEVLELANIRGPRGDKPIFECFWNGRLIPYTTIDSLEWCAPPKKKTLIPQECYYRISGSLFTDDSFQVSTNKLTFIDLEGKLKEKSTIFNKVVMGQEQRTYIGRAFNEWVKQCHETCDKQIKFFGFSGKVNRKDVTQKRNQGLWSVYKAVEWDAKTFKVGELIRTTRTVPIIVGKIQKFYLHGNYEEDEVFATGGEMEIVQEPESIYGDAKVLPLAKLDRNTSASALREFIQSEELKLPATLSLEWPDNNELIENAKMAAGSTIGPVKVDILNGKGESVNKLPGERMKKLLVELKVVSHCEKDGDKTILQLTCQHGGKSWPYWFRKIENISDIGHHTLQLKTIVSDSNASTNLKSLPSLDVAFVVTEAEAHKFTVGVLETPLRVGVPFQIPLTLQDKFGNNIKPNTNEFQPILSAPGMELKSSGTVCRGNSLIVKEVMAEGSVPSVGGKDFNMKISFSKLADDSQTIRLRLLPGPPFQLETVQNSSEIENGGIFRFDVQIKDKAGNVTSQPRLNVICKVIGVQGVQPISCDCSSTGKGLIVSQPIDIKSIKGPKVITARLDLQHYKEVKSIDREIVVRPSSKASKIEVYYTPAGSAQSQLIANGQDIQCVAGEAITGLSLIVFDEGNRKLQIDQSLASKIKINWIGKVNREDLKEGKIPDIKAPLSVNDAKYCQVICTAGSGNTDFFFNLKATHAAPSTLKLSCSNIQFKMNDPVPADIVVSVHDDYGNFISVAQKDLQNLSVSGEGLKELLVVKKVHRGSFVLQNVNFEIGAPGPRALCIQWNDIVCYQKLEMLPGPAVNMILVNLDNKEPFDVLNGNAFPKTIKIQLVDAAGNKTNEKNVRCMLQRDPGLKLSPPPAQQRTDENGQATFTNFSINAERGLYQIVPKAMLSTGNTEGPTILVNVEPDRTKPVQLVTNFVDQRVFTAGSKFPVIEVHLLSEDETPVRTVKNKDIVMKLWSNQHQGKSQITPAKASVYTASTGNLNDPKFHFYFRNIKVPEQTGQYNIIIQYMNKNVAKLSSKPFAVTVFPGDPVKLVPVTIPATPTASNNSKNASRQLVKNLKFELKDKFGNTAGLDLQGTLNVSVEDNGRNSVPLLQNGHRNAAFEFCKGSATVQQLMLQADTAGDDGQEYVLSFEATPAGSQKLPIEPFKLSFLFYDDVQKQAQMSGLTKERDTLTEKLRTYRALFDARSQLLKEVQAAYREATAQEQNLRKELKAKGYKDANKLETKQQISNATSSLRNTKTDLETRPRRQCRLPKGRNDKGIIGKVGHLAVVHEDDVARVLSWHLASDMDCVITTTTEQAMKINRESNGRQQVLPLDSIYKRGLPDWKKPLPHERIPAIKSPGNVIYARDFLRFPEHEDQCKIIFGMLLGDTIITDTLDVANRYRREIVKHTYCPTILTRNGERIRSNGKFGGLQNNAPPLERMNGAVFSCPLPATYQSLCSQIDILSNLEAAVSRVYEVKSELQVQVAECRSQSMEDDYAECLETEDQLRSIEAKLKLTPKRRPLPPTLAQFFAFHAPTENGTAMKTASKRAVANDGAHDGPTYVKRGRLSFEKSQNDVSQRRSRR